MGRYKDFRRPRRRDHDDADSLQDQMLQGAFDGVPPSRTSEPLAPAIEAAVKWFNPAKGFGFVQARDGTDAFLHVRQLEAVGHNTVPEGAVLTVRIGQSEKGHQVTEVIDVDLAAQATAPFGNGQGHASTDQDGPAEEAEGAVKWYNSDKGFGFIGLDGGGKDVFIHAKTLERCGLGPLAEGQRLIVKFAHGKKGPEARSVEPLT